MADSPPPAYSELNDDPFVDRSPAPAPTQPYGAQPPPIDYRALHGYGPDIPVPEDFVPESNGSGKWHVVTAGTEIVITQEWGVCAARSQGIPGGLHKSQPTWAQAIRYYTKCYRDGSIRIVKPRTPSATPARSTSAAGPVHSAASTPARGERTRPIYVFSSPAATPVRSRHSVMDTAPHSPVPGDQSLPIMVASSPVAPSASIEERDDRKEHDDRSPRTIKRHAYLEKIFEKALKEKAQGSSEPSTSDSQASPSQHEAAWRDSTPVSIPHALPASGSRSTTRASTDSRHHSPPSTPTKSGTGTVLGDEDDIDYFADEIPLTDADLEALWEWEQTLELQAALSSPRFD